MEKETKERNRRKRLKKGTEERNRRKKQMKDTDERDRRKEQMKDTEERYRRKRQKKETYFANRQLLAWSWIKPHLELCVAQENCRKGFSK